MSDEPNRVRMRPVLTGYDMLVGDWLWAMLAELSPPDPSLPVVERLNYTYHPHRQEWTLDIRCPACERWWYGYGPAAEDVDIHRTVTCPHCGSVSLLDFHTT